MRKLFWVSQDEGKLCGTPKGTVTGWGPGMFMTLPGSHLNPAQLPLQPLRVSPCFLSCHTLMLKIIREGYPGMLVSSGCFPYSVPSWAQLSPLGARLWPTNHSLSASGLQPHCPQSLGIGASNSAGPNRLKN